MYTRGGELRYPVDFHQESAYADYCDCTKTEMGETSAEWKNW
jgi:hypothetical protein